MGPCIQYLDLCGHLKAFLYLMLSNMALSCQYSKTTFSKVTTLRNYTRPPSTYIMQYLFTLKNPLYIALASNRKARSARMMMVVIAIILAMTSQRRKRQRRKVTAAVPPTVTTRMTIMTTTTIKSVIAMKIYELLHDVSFFLWWSSLKTEPQGVN